MKNEYKSNSLNITINDNLACIAFTKKYTILLIIAYVLSLMLGITNILRYFKNNDLFLLYSGILIVLIWIPSIIYFLRSRKNREFNIKKINKVIIKKNILNTLMAEFSLKESNKVKIPLDFSDETLNSFKHDLSSKNLLMEK